MIERYYVGFKEEDFTRWILDSIKNKKYNIACDATKMDDLPEVVNLLNKQDQIISGLMFIIRHYFPNDYDNIIRLFWGNLCAE